MKAPRVALSVAYQLGQFAMKHAADILMALKQFLAGQGHCYSVFIDNSVERDAVALGLFRTDLRYAR